MYSQPHFSKRGFTVLELLVAVSVTALLAGMLLNITSQVIKTQTQASGNLETNQAAQFILDRIQEDLQCAIYRNDGNIWMAADILNSTENSGNWNDSKYKVPKPEKESLRIKLDHWPSEALNAQQIANKQGQLTDTRFGIAGTWLRFFTEAPELDPDAKNSGGARAISYQILRHGLTSSETSTPRYQLFRSDVSDINTLNSGYNLDAENGPYSNTSDDGPRESGNVKNPIFKNNGKLNVVIFTHEINDAANGNGKGLYPDYYEWLKEIINVSEEIINDKNTKFFKFFFATNKKNFKSPISKKLNNE